MNSAISRWRFVRFRSTMSSVPSQVACVSYERTSVRRVARRPDGIKPSGRVVDLPGGARVVEQLAQHVVQDPAVAVVEPLLRRVDPDPGLELDRLAILRRRLDREG